MMVLYYAILKRERKRQEQGQARRASSTHTAFVQLSFFVFADDDPPFWTRDVLPNRADRADTRHPRCAFLTARCSC
jgi:hypothetical protein